MTTDTNTAIRAQKTDARGPDLVRLLEEQILPRLRPEDVYPGIAFSAGDPLRGDACPYCNQAKDNRAFEVWADGLNFFCHACGAKGSALAALNGGETPRGKRFVELVRELGRLAGVGVPERELSPAEAKRIEEHRLRREALEAVAKICREALEDETEGAQARAYLGGRGLGDAETRERWGLGFYPSVAHVRAALPAELRAPAKKAGLLDAKSYNNAGRIVYPWRDANGSLLCCYFRFAGGTPPEGESKTHSPWGAKTKASPFGLWQARKHKRLVVAEGPADVMALHKAGVENAVAWVGRVPSKEQVETLQRRGVERVTILGDADPFGRLGVVDTARTLGKAGVAVFVAGELPNGDDPASFLADGTPERAEDVRARIARAESFPRWRARNLGAAWSAAKTDGERADVVAQVPQEHRAFEAERARLEFREALAGAVGEERAAVWLGGEALEAAGQWWKGARFESFEAVPDGPEGVRVVRIKRNAEGEPSGFELLATCVVRRVAIKRPAGDGPALEEFEVFARGKTRRFEAEAGIVQSQAKWRQLIQANAPRGFLGQGPKVLDAINGLMESISEASPPREIRVHRAGFNKALDAYRVPGWRIAADGCHPEAPEVCPEGFGTEGRAGLCPDARQARETAAAWAEEWPKLYAKSPADATIALASGLCAPFVAPLAGSPCNVLLALVGGTGSGKTTHARLLGSLHGQDGRLGSHGTPKGYMLVAQGFRDSLTLVDDLREGRLIRDFAASAFDGSRRPTSTRDQKLNRSPSLRGAVVLTAETLDGAGESTMNRLVRIDFPKTPASWLPEINAAKARLRVLANPSALAAEALRLALSAGPERLKAALQDTTHAAEQHPLGSARGRELAALVGLCVGLLRDTFAHVLGGLPEWLATPAEAMDRVLATHAREEAQAKPSRIFLDALNESLGTRADLLEARVEWSGRARTSVRGARGIGGEVPRPERGETLVLRIQEGDKSLLFIPPRVTLRALGLDLPEGAIRQSLEDEGLLVPGAGGAAATRLYVPGPNKQLRGWLIREDAPGGSDKPGSGRSAWLQANSQTGILGLPEGLTEAETQLGTGVSYHLQSNSQTPIALASRKESENESENETSPPPDVFGPPLIQPLLRAESLTVCLKSSASPVVNSDLASGRPSGKSVFAKGCLPEVPPGHAGALPGAPRVPPRSAQLPPQTHD